MAVGDFYFVSNFYDRILRRIGGYPGTDDDRSQYLRPDGAGQPSGLAIDPANGSLYWFDSITRRIYWSNRSINFSGDQPSWDRGLVSYDSGQRIGGARGLALDSVKRLYLINTRTNKIHRRSAEYPGGVWDDGIDIPAGMTRETNVAIDLQDRLYVCDNAKAFQRIGGYPGTRWDSGIDFPTNRREVVDIDFDENGDMYLFNSNVGQVHKRAGGYSGRSWDAGLYTTLNSLDDGLIAMSIWRTPPPPSPAGLVLDGTTIVTPTSHKLAIGSTELGGMAIGDQIVYESD